MKGNNESKNVKVWGEHINLVQFLLGLLISVAVLAVTLLITHYFISTEYEVKLISGLIGVLIGFVINLVWIKPKRDIVVKEQENDN